MKTKIGQLYEAQINATMRNREDDNEETRQAMQRAYKEYSDYTEAQKAQIIEQAKAGAYDLFAG